MRRFLPLCTLALILSACGSIFPQPGEPTKKYVLGSLNQSAGVNTPMPSSASRPHQLIVDLPTLYPPLDNTRIALKPQEQVVDYYADVEWADRLSALLQESLIYSFQNKGILRGVSRPTESIQADYMLKIEVRKFYVDQSGAALAPTAQVDYMVHLVKLPNRHIVASRNFTHVQALPENSMDSIVKSLNTAHLEVSKALVPWVLGHIH